MRNISLKLLLLLVIASLFVYDLSFAQKSKTKIEKRIALVIGNCNYSTDTFINSANDAKLMTETFKKVKFDVSLLIDAKYDEIKNAIDKFLNKLQKEKSSVGLLYFTGNGFQVSGINYFLPIDKVAKNEVEIRTNSINIREIFERLAKIKNNLNIIILDLPRSNPFAEQFRNGSAGSPFELFNSFVIYSTSPGSAIYPDKNRINSVFATELSKAILIGKIEISEVFKIVSRNMHNYPVNIYNKELNKNTESYQQPWSISLMSKEFYFVK